jgi:hypothetical protein
LPRTRKRANLSMAERNELAALVVELAAANLKKVRR